MTADEACGAVLADRLRDPATFELPAGEEVECLETHISWVFLTPRHAYKLKKPVRFDFLDFSTSERRRAACLDEVRLNRRLAPQVYLGVEPVTLDSRGRARLAGSGQVVDWVVKMRRLPADRALDRLLAAGQLAPYELQQLGASLTDFYLGLPPVTVKTDEYRARLQHHVDDNFRELMQRPHGLPVSQVRRIHAAQQALLLLQPETFDARVCDGRIVEGHGDLRPEHIYLHAGPKIIDCIEFNLEYRQLDVADELSFLTMECALLGAESLGEQLMGLYCRASGDDPPEALRGFYGSYRACVRGKVAALRAEQMSGARRDDQLETARRYLDLADRYARRLGAPLLLIVRGLSGTGKSTLAEALAERLRLVCLQTDVVRRELFPLPPESAPLPPDSEVDSENADTGRYRAENRQRVYRRMLELAERQLEEHGGVVLDGTFLGADSQRRAVALARQYNARPVVIECHCPDEVARRRIAARRQAGTSVSDAFPDLVDQQRREQQPSPRHVPLCRVDTTASLPDMLQRVLACLRSAT